MHHLQFGGYVLLLVSQEYANTQFQFVEPQWGGEPWTTAWLVPCSGHGAAEWERAEKQLGGTSQPALPEGPDALRKCNSDHFQPGLHFHIFFQF